jgi:hypothetical protein
MRQRVGIENIEGMRRWAGIDDVELQEAIRGLQVGDFVKLTLLTGTTSFAGETLAVRITRIRGNEFRGKLAERPATTGLSELRVGSPVTFTRDHIHSIAKR